jgi:hypothetical protein
MGPVLLPALPPGLLPPVAGGFLFKSSALSPSPQEAVSSASIELVRRELRSMVILFADYYR